jgi:putative membrane protein
VLAPMAYNQGFYNLFLAIIALVGVGLLGTEHWVGSALALAGTGSMLAAAVVLVAHDRSMVRAALMQGTLPALAVLFLLLEL